MSRACATYDELFFFAGANWLDLAALAWQRYQNVGRGALIIPFEIVLTWQRRTSLPLDAVSYTPLSDDEELEAWFAPHDPRRWVDLALTDAAAIGVSADRWLALGGAVHRTGSLFPYSVDLFPSPAAAYSRKEGMDRCTSLADDFWATEQWRRWVVPVAKPRVNLIRRRGEGNRFFGVVR